MRNTTDGQDESGGVGGNLGGDADIDLEQAGEAGSAGCDHLGGLSTE